MIDKLARAGAVLVLEAAREVLDELFERAQEVCEAVLLALLKLEVILG